MKENKFYKTSYHGGVGSTVMFWGVDGKGYVTDIDQAEIYTLEQMKDHVKNDRFRSYDEHPLSVAQVEDLATWRVDMQHINESDHYPNSVDPNDEYVAVKKGCYDGNDIYFNTGLGESHDYSKARIINRKMVDLHIGDLVEGYFYIPKSITDEKARRTFQFKNINRRKMITNAGITGIRKPRERQDSGKTRWNCPVCGKISWQYNPYDFDGCKDICCSAWRSHAGEY